MDPASASLADRFRLALDACDASHARADHTPVVSEMKSWSAFPPAQAPPPAGPGVQHIYPTACAAAGPPAEARAAPLLAAYPFPPQPAAPPAPPPDQSPSGRGLGLLWMLLAALALAAVAIFLRRRILAWFKKKSPPPPEEDEDSQAEDAAGPLRALARQERKPKKSQCADLPLLPRSLTKREVSKAAASSARRAAPPSRLDREAAAGRPLHRGQAAALPPRRVTIQELPEEVGEEEASCEEDCLEAPGEPADPNFVEI